METQEIRELLVELAEEIDEMECPPWGRMLMVISSLDLLIGEFMGKGIPEEDTFEGAVSAYLAALHIQLGEVIQTMEPQLGGVN